MSIDTHGSGPPAQYFEPDPATVEACAKIVDAAMKSKDLGARSPKLIASTIRSLVSGEPQSSDGGVEGHALSQTSPTTQQSQDSRGLRGVHLAGIKPGPSEAIQSGYADYTPVTVRAHTVPNSAGALESSHRGPSAGENDPVVKQDCAPAGTGPTAEGRVDYRKFAEWVGLGGRMPDDAALALYLEIELDNRAEVTDAVEAAVIREACEALSQRHRLTRSAVSETKRKRAEIGDDLIGPICELADLDFTGDTQFDALIGAAMTIRDREGFVVTDEDEL